MNSRTKTISAAMGSVVLLGSTALGISVAQTGMVQTAEAADQPGVAASQRGSASAAAEGVTSVANVQGSFAFDQEALTATSAIASTFVKAASSLCASMPDYDVSQLDQRIAVRGSDGSYAEATLSDMEKAEGAKAHVMACSCASNVAGGGAVANAEVSGVDFETVAHLAGELD